MICQNVPTKIDLYTDNLVVFNAQNFRIAPSLSILPRHFIGNHDFIIVFYEPQKVELLTLSGSRPAPLKISSVIEAHIESARKCKILSQMLLKKSSIADGERFVRSLC
jgi:hypothetical protein